jgi:hypothetical protein
MTEPTEDLYRMIRETSDGRAHRHINVSDNSVAVMELHMNDSTGLEGDVPARGDFRLTSIETLLSADRALTRAKQLYDESIDEGFVDFPNDEQPDDTEPGIRSQNVVPHTGINVNHDELLTNPDTSDISMDDLHHKLKP